MKRHPLTFCLGALALLSLFPATAAEPPIAPMLRIEAGMHTSAIMDLSVDASGEVALTCGLDKTARLWSLPDGKLLKTFRPPVDGGHEGKLIACALSPDGKLAAVAGYTGVTWKGTGHIHIFETSSGRMLQTLDTKIWADIRALRFSATGKFLAAGLWKGGVRIWTAQGQLLGQDEAYGAACDGLDWSGDEVLASTCLDGQVRSYKELATQLSDPSKVSPLTPALIRRCTLGQQPESIQFSPDGKELAVGFADRPVVEVLSAANLSLAFEPSVKDIKSNVPIDLRSVAWSRDGRTLCAGGNYCVLRPDKTWGVGLRVWGQSGRGTPTDIPVAQDNISGLQPDATDGFVFVSMEPVWGQARPSGANGANAKEKWKLTLSGKKPKADYRTNLPGFRITPDVDAVGFSFLEFGTAPAWFSVTKREMKMGAAPKSLKAPDLKTVPVTGWNYRDDTPPQIDGQPLKLGKGERSLAYAVGKGGKSVFLGTESRVIQFSRDGKERWSFQAPYPVWAINLSDDGRTAAVAYEDGTIRWHDLENNGRELLAFYPHSDHKRWVLWAPDYAIASRAFLGVAWKTSDSPTSPPTVESLIANSGAAVAGLQAHDLVLAVDGTAVSTSQLANEIIQKKKPGDKIEIRLSRSGTIQTLTATLGTRPEMAGELRGVYYDCSPGAEDLIGWQVNRGNNQEADFFPASKFRDRFYRPDVIQRVLQTRDVAKALTAANEAAGRKPAATASAADVVAREAPPVVSLLDGGPSASLELNGSTVSVRYTVRSPSSPATRMTFKLNGRPIEIQAPLPPDERTHATATLPAPEQDAILSVLAENRYAVSEPATLRLVRSASTATVPSATARPADVPAVLKPKLYVLAVGVSDYSTASGLRDLGLAAKDAEDFAAAFKAQEGLLYQKVETQLLQDDGATASAVRKGLDWLLHQTTTRDVCAILLAGHGENDNRGRYFFCPHDYDTKSRLDSSVSYETIRDTMSSVPGKVLFFVDTCHAGNALGKMQTRGVAEQDLNRLANELSSAENGAVVFCSSTGQQLSQEKADWGNGAFTKAVVEGLSGRADLLGNGKITIATLEAYVAERVKELTDGAQSPTVAKPDTVPDFPIAAKR